MAILDHFSRFANPLLQLHMHATPGRNNWVTCRSRGESNTPYFVSPQRNHSIPYNSLPFWFSV